MRWSTLTQAAGLAALAGLLAAPVLAGAPLREGAGLAAAYPGDAGIDKDPAVIFHTGFEPGQADGHQDGRAPEALTTDPARVHSGRYASALEVQPGKTSGNGGVSHLFRPGYEQVYVRWYALYAEDYNQGFGHHDGCMLLALNNRWMTGRSGVKPMGNDVFCTTLQTGLAPDRNGLPGAPFLYTYFVDMRRDPDGNYWGNSLTSDTPLHIARGRWYCFEMMAKLNTVGKADGEQAFWVDGKLLGHFTGMRLRTADSLKLNEIILGLYIHENKQVNRLWYDDVVVATSYIGPMKQ